MRHRMLRASVLASVTTVAVLPLAATAATAAPAPSLPGNSAVQPAVLERPAPPHRAATITGDSVRLHAEDVHDGGPQIAWLNQRDVITKIRCVDIGQSAETTWYHVDVAGKPSGVVNSQFVTLLDNGPQCYQPAPTPVM